MTLRRCREPMCPELVPPGVRQGRCPEHRKTQNRSRGSRKDRGYGSDHQALRADWQRRLDAGESIACHNPTCTHPGDAVDPTSWHLGHDDRRRHRGPEHPDCNLAEAGRASH